MTEFLPTHKFKLDIKSHNALPFFLFFFFSSFFPSIFSTRFSLSSTTFCRDMFATVPVTTCSLSHHLLTACLVLRRRPRLLIFYTGKQRNRVGSGVEKRRSMRHRNFTPTQDAVIRGDNSRFSPPLALSLSLSISFSYWRVLLNPSRDDYVKLPRREGFLINRYSATGAIRPPRIMEGRCRDKKRNTPDLTISLFADILLRWKITATREHPLESGWIVFTKRRSLDGTA